MDLPFDGALALRRRSVWEAADAGILLWRKDLLYFLPFFALPVWVCAFSLRLLPDHLWPLSWFILWYLRPFFDRLVLQVVSARFFNSPARGLLRGLLPNLFRGLAGDLLWRRFSPWRPAMTPVRTLERLSPARTRRRKKALSGGGIDFCVFLSLWSLVLEAILLGGEILFALISLTMIQPGFIDSPGDFFSGKEIFFYTAWCVNGIFTESLYVCMGFSLYINSRVELEGWDLELLFRGFRRGRRENSPWPRAAGGLTLAICLLAALSPPALAQEAPPAPAVFSEAGGEAPGGSLGELPGELPLERLQGILASPEFGGEREGWGIRFRNREKTESLSFNLAPWFPAIQRIFALVLRTLLVLSFLALGIFCALYFYRMREPGNGRVDRGKAGALPGEEPKTPEELLAEARDLHRTGRIREAWARCFAASLAAWSRYRQVNFPAGATEYRCLALVRGLAPARPAQTARRAVQQVERVHPDQADPAQAEGPGSAACGSFAELIANWVALAYGGRIPPEGAFERALAWIGDLCGTPEDRGLP
ncbi:MAG: DUF4129 domain-containing protein [Treponema sp.]|jgi:hypothetical protein|nr:DUF4129 domain-containing protein [Treponema sp.]